MSTGTLGYNIIDDYSNFKNDQDDLDNFQQQQEEAENSGQQERGSYSMKCVFEPPDEVRAIHSYPSENELQQVLSSYPLQENHTLINTMFLACSVSEYFALF